MDCERPNRGNRLLSIHPSLIAMSGLLVVGLGLLASRSTPKPSRGKLVPKQEMLTWQSPGGKPFRTLSIEEAQATFEIENVGATPVRILEARSSCGCATPEVQPTPISPGELRAIQVRANPVQIGERMASISLKTDSAESPEIILRLRIIGNRRPPFMGQANGDLAFNGESSDETREIIAFQVELAGSTPLPPVAKTDIPFLKLATPTLVEERPSSTPDTVSRKYSLKVSLNGRLTPGVNTGDVSVIDPWDPDHVETIRFHGELLPPIRAVPARVVVNAGKTQGVTPTANVVIIANPPVSDLVSELDAKENAPLVLGPIKMSGDSRQGSFSVTAKPGKARTGTYHVRIGRSSNSERITVPVSVREEDL